MRSVFVRVAKKAEIGIKWESDVRMLRPLMLFSFDIEPTSEKMSELWIWIPFHCALGLCVIRHV